MKNLSKNGHCHLLLTTCRGLLNVLSFVAMEFNMKAGPLMLDLQGTELDLGEAELLRHPMVGGVIFFARNFVGREQIADLSAAIKAIRPELLIAVDQEGGRVQRFRDGYSKFPPMAKLGRWLQESPEQGADLLRDAGWLLAAEVIASGVDFSFAPVLDVDDCRCEVIADRAFAADAELATEAARLFIAGMHEAGMAATGKHFPGHGGVVADSHHETPRDERSLAELYRHDLIPFKTLAAELDAIMPAHIVFPQVDSHCVGFSSHWLQEVLRKQLGFNGVIFSDDLSMRGADVAGGYPQKAEAALNAGCDMVLVCNNPAGAIEVLSYLEDSNPAPSARLATMKARKSWAWRELEDSERRESTIARFAALT